MAAANSLDLESDLRAIIASPLFDVPRDLMSSAFTDPEHLAKGWGPHRFALTTLGSNFRHSGGGENVEPVQFSTTISFADVGQGKTRLTWHMLFFSGEERARVIREYGADNGLTQTLARSAEHLAAAVSPRA